VYFFADGYRDAWAREYPQLRPLSDYRADYHVLQTSKDEWLIRRIRLEMEAAGVPIEFSKGEWGLGQHEINLEYADALEMADRHVVYKNGVKEIAALNQVAVTFMAKWSMAQAGSSFHLHSSLWDVKSDKALFHSVNGGPHGMSTLFQHYLAGLIALARDFSLFYAPFVNSYKRYQASSSHPPRSSGATTTAPAASASSATGRACAWNAAFPAPTPIPTWPSRRRSPPGCTVSSTSSPCHRRSVVTPTRRRICYACRAT